MKCDAGVISDVCTVEGSATNPYAIGIEQCAHNIGHMLMQARDLAGIDENTPLCSVVCCCFFFFSNKVDSLA